MRRTLGVAGLAGLALASAIALGACAAPAPEPTADPTAEEAIAAEEASELSAGSEDHWQEGDLTAGPAHPCGLITPDQAGEALGEPVEAGVDQPSGLAGQVSCSFTALDSPVRAVTVSIVAGDDALWAVLRNESPGAQAVQGVGDAAFRDAGLLRVRRGDMIISISINGLDGGSNLTNPLTKLAEAALAGL